VEWISETGYDGRGPLLDPMCGSGTTLKMCRKAGRNGIGFELNPAYEEIIRKRIMANQIDLRSYKED